MKDDRVYLVHCLIHDYFGIDLAIVWEVVRSDLPELGRDIETILANIPC